MISTATPFTTKNNNDNYSHLRVGKINFIAAQLLKIVKHYILFYE